MFLEMLIANTAGSIVLYVFCAIAAIFFICVVVGGTQLHYFRGGAIDQQERRRKEALPRPRTKHFKSVIALVREDDYLTACGEYEEKVRRGEIKPWERVVVVVRPTFVFWGDESAKTFMHVGGLDEYCRLINEFYYLPLQVARPEDAPNLFVPFLNQAIYTFEEQVKMFPRYSLEEARNYLLTKQLPGRSA